MDAQQAFTQFVQRCLSPEKARRFTELCASKKGQRKVLASLYHEFEPAVRSSAVRPIEVETSQIHVALESYKARFGAFPVGDSAAVFRALRGQNPERLVFFKCRAESVSPDGSLLDPWGTPYRVYFSGNEIIIRSAGPNKQFDTSGDKHFDDYIR